MRTLLVILVVLVAGGPTIGAAGPDTLAVTYIGNAGFLIEADGRKILIDALYRDGVPGYVVHPAARRHALERARPPFDGVDLVLATHVHDDHFDADAVAAHLRNNPEALFLSTPQAVERLQAAAGEGTAGPRAVAVHVEEGERFRRAVNGIEVQVISLHHGRGSTVQNFGFLASIGGWTILHIGDTEATVEEFLLHDLAADDIDIAFVPYWFLIAGGRDDDRLRALSAERIAVMHVPPRDSRAQHIEELGGWDAMMDQIEARYPAAVTFREPMQSRSFSHSPR